VFVGLDVRVREVERRPAQSNDPNDSRSISTWTQRGTMNATLAEIMAGARSAFYAT
jgi:hypothetical protein